ncbi:MAG TPA: hypothetical protein DCR45_08450 [Gammaproteobacteria bacterium]|nr:hypothetical protein [Gammaproteobacteria bacterium]
MMKETIAGGIDRFTGRTGDDFIVGIDDCVDAAYISGITGLGINRQRKKLSKANNKNLTMYVLSILMRCLNKEG